MKLLREPLLHFLLLGAAIFAAFSLVSNDSADKPDQIVITRGKIENMVTAFTRTWQRPPTEQELNGLIQDYLREEVAYREAKTMGLDQDDTVVRRRLRQKLEFVSEDLAGLAEPTETELQAYLTSHAEDFRTDPMFTFRQVYLNPEDHGANLKRDAEELLSKLQLAGENADVYSVGDSFVLDHHFVNIPAKEVDKLFGETFAEEVSALNPGRWQGPIESGYGVHLVFVSERTEERLPALEEVREEVRREWVNAKRLETTEQFYQALLQRYTVTIEPPQERKIAEMR